MWLSDGLIRHVQWWRGLDALTVLHGVILAAVYTGTLLWAANYYRCDDRTVTIPSLLCYVRWKLVMLRGLVSRLGVGGGTQLATRALDRGSMFHL